MSKVGKIFGGGGNDSAAIAADSARQREVQRQQRIKQGRGFIDTSFAKFDEPYFDKRAGAYMDYATPQLEDQYRDERDNLVFALSRKGNLNSSSAVKNNTKLATQLERNREQIGSTAKGYATDAKRGVNNARTDLISLLNATEDPAAIRDEAVRRASLESQAPSFSPLGKMFESVAGNLERMSGPATGYEGYARGGSPLFQDRRSGGSGRVIN